MTASPIRYTDLNARQKENYNFHKIAAVLADYGYYCMWLNDDWQGADFIANHIDGRGSLKVQLKSRLTIDRKYIGKDIHIAFRHAGGTYLYPHDTVMLLLFKLLPQTAKRKSWERKGRFSWPNPMPKKLEQLLAEYKL